MTRLSNAALPDLGARAPAYDRTAVGIGIVHFGPGAFHRAHQAAYTDEALAISGGDWGICAVSLNSRTAAEALAPQDGLFTLQIKDKLTSCRVIGSIKEVLCARDVPDLVMARLTDPGVKIVTLTITEKGYALTPGGRLDMQNPAVQHDLAAPDAPETAMGYLVAACRLRREKNLPPLTIICCDNLPHNGQTLRRLCLDYAEAAAPEISDHIANDIRFPNTMVDSITPATTDAVKAEVAEALGVEDAGPVQREYFTQWVIEDNLPEDCPDWAGAGAIISKDVEGFENTKLRILNGAHSTLTYLGLLAGIETVEEAINTPFLRDFADGLITTETIPSISAPEGLDLATYWAKIKARFENPHIRHLLEQISHDGSQKIPGRICPVISHHASQGNLAEHACFVAAAWIEWSRQRRAAGRPPTDGFMDRISDRLPDPAQPAAAYAGAILALPDILPDAVRQDRSACARIQYYVDLIHEVGVEAAAGQITA